MKPFLNYTQSYLTERLIEILDGFLLGDGNIEKPKKNAARLNIKQKQREFSEWIAANFSDYDIKIREKHQFDKRTNKTYVSWAGKSHSHPDLFKQYHRWYPDGKRIPADVRLTPNALLIWYLGDGCLEKRKGGGSHRILFATQSFTSTQIDTILLPKLNSLCPNAFHRTNRNEIRSNCGDLTSFFDYIGWSSPVQCMNYKFRDREYFTDLRRKCSEGMLVGRFKKKFDDNAIIQMRKNGMRYEDIAKKIGSSIALVYQICPVGIHPLPQG